MAQSPNQSALLEILHIINTATGSNPLFRRSLQDLILEYGWWYEPVEVPDRIAAGTRKQCFTNSAELALPDCSLVYCEGYALSNAGTLPALHAWGTDCKGNAFDNTWPTHDWQNKCGRSVADLRDRPEEWLKERGNGVAGVLG